jgi:uncharacterized RDD family membrane protein YckC
VGEQGSSDGSRPDVPIGGRLLEGGARGVGRIAGVAGLDRTVEVAVEDAIVGALESAAVERAISRLVEDGRLARAIEDAIDGDQLEASIRRAIDSEVADNVWEDLLASDKAQMLVERIAEAPEIRVAVAAQGAGLIWDLGRQIAKASAVVDKLLERVARQLFRRPPRETPTDHAGLVTRGIAIGVDFGLLTAAFAIFSALLVGLQGLFSNVESLPAWIAGLLSFCAVLAAGLYLTGFWAFEGQTPGMRFVCIHLEHDEGDGVENRHGIGPRRAFRRLIGLILAVLPFGLGLVAILFTDRRRGFQDRFADTDVVHRSNRVLASWAENLHPGDPG